LFATNKVTAFVMSSTMAVEVGGAKEVEEVEEHVDVGVVGVGVGGKGGARVGVAVLVQALTLMDLDLPSAFGTCIQRYWAQRSLAVSTRCAHGSHNLPFVPAWNDSLR
jgi:hypothetical protein